MMETLNPWDHASEIARRLMRPDAELLAVIGASGWCSRCQDLQPRFEALSRELPPHIVPLWLDLEEHAEFLDDFIPPDLPLLLRWRQGVCVQAAIVEGIDQEAAQADRVRLKPLALDEQGLRDPHQGGSVALPPLWHEFGATA